MKKLSPAAVIAALLIAALVGCSNTSEPDDSLGPSQPVDDSSETVSVDNELNDIYLEEVANFPYDLPEGYAFPDEIPAVTWFDGNPVDEYSASGMAYQWWGCAKFDAAWDAVDAGDMETADAHLADILHSTNKVDPGMSMWTSSYEGWGIDRLRVRGSGDSGFCIQWWNRLEALE